MKAYALLGLVMAMPAVAQTSEGQSPADAAKLAMETCVEHARGSTPIESKSAAQLEARGLLFQRDPPEFLASTRSTVLGIGQYAKAPSTTGEIWAIGYDSDGCMVVTLAAPVAEVEQGYNAFFEQAKVWREERASGGRPGEKLMRYSWNPRRTLKLTATISLREAENTTTVTFSQSTR